MLSDGLRLGFGALNIYTAQDYNIEWKQCKKFNTVHAHLENQEKKYTWIQTHFWKNIKQELEGHISNS